MARKKADEGQLDLVPMTKDDYDHAAKRFAALQIQKSDLIDEKKRKLKRYSDDITEITQTMQTLAESIQAYEASHD